MAAPHRGQNSSPPGVDRLSALPESVLTYLLSFLTTKECVKTSILSRKWRFLWQYVRVIHLYGQTENIISRVLMRNKVESIDTLRLFLDKGPYSDYQIETWIIAAAERNVRKIALYSDILPSRLFTCESLVDLKLNCPGIPMNPHALCLPRLKTLYLDYIRYEEEGALTPLLSGCPILEELEIICYLYVLCCNISSPSIKRLSLSIETNSEFENNNGPRVELNTPTLKDLQLELYSSELIESGPLLCLIRADIRFDNALQLEEDHSRYCASLLNFVNRLSRVEYLKFDLSSYVQGFHSVFCSSTINFPNLTKLKLDADGRILSKFLQSANSLQFLSFRVLYGWVEPQQLPKCLLSHLRTITLVGFSDAHEGLEKVRYLLSNARVLERMIISFRSDLGPEEQTSMRKDISLFERGSKTCELDFSQILYL